MNVRKIRKEMKHLYLPPKEWAALRKDRLEQHDHKCARCRVPNGMRVWRRGDLWQNEYPGHFFEHSGWRKVKIVLTIAHLDHDPTHNEPGNTLPLCQLCHNRHDAKHRAEGRRARKMNSLAEIRAAMEEMRGCTEDSECET